MSLADKMFDDLGFTKDRDTSKNISYVKGSEIVYISLTLRTVSFRRKNKPRISPLVVSVPLFLATQQKMKEVGLLNESI